MTEHRNTTATVRAVLAAAADKGVAPDILLDAAGIPKSLAMDPDGEVTLQVMRGFWEEAYARCDDPYLAIHAALKAVHGTYRTLDYLMFSAATLADGVGRFIQHFRLINTWLNFELEDCESGAALILQSKIGPVPPPAVEITFAALTERCRLVLGPAWAPVSISFLHQGRGDASFYEGYFRCPVAFGSGTATMVFPGSQWNTPLPGGDEGLFRVLETHASMLSDARPMPDDMVGQASAEILKLLSDVVPSIEDVARRLGIGSRTFQRRLAESDTHFTQLIDDVREAQAKTMVASGTMSLSETAFFLGFAEPSAFSRAFKRWTGRTPSDFRRSEV